VTIVLLR